MTSFDLDLLCAKPPARRGLTKEEREGGRFRLSTPRGGDPAEIELTADQQDALDAMLKWEASDEPAFTLSGYAGTGKTTVVQEYLKVTETVAALTGQNRVRSPRVLAAPTNKAVRVLDEMASAYNLTVPCMTVHRLLGMRMQSDAEEKYCVASGENTIEGLEVVVVDECSMVGDRPTGTARGEVPGLYSQLMGQAARWGVKVLFVGDPAQLPPINEGKLSRAFDHPGAFLERVVRQAEGNPIIRLASYVRGVLEGADPGRPDLSSDGFNGVERISDKRDFNALMVEAYLDAADHPTRYKALAFRRDSVKRYCDRVHRALHGVAAPKYVVGGRYVTTAPVMDWPEGRGFPRILAATDEDAVLVDQEPTRHPDLPQYGALMLTLRNEEGSFPATVAHPDDELRWERDVAALRSKAKKRQISWPDFWRLNDAFAALQQHYAMTCHRSQGSTYETTFVDVPDILSHPSGKWEALRCLYTAVTRASKMVYLYEGE